MDPNTRDPVIDLIEEQKNIDNMGGTMRLSSYKCKLDKESLAYKAYQKDIVSERHRHRYEFNNKFRKLFEENGIRLAGINPEKDLVEIIELKDHPWFVGVQFHPEYSSTVKEPHPMFVDFVKAALKHKNTLKE